MKKESKKTTSSKTSKPVVVTRYRNDTPLRMLKECINYPVEVKTARVARNSKTYKGVLKDVSDNMNVVLHDETMVQGNKIKYVVLPDIMSFSPLLNGRDELVYTNKQAKQKYKNKQGDTKKDTKKTGKKPAKSEAEELAKELAMREQSKKNTKRKLENDTTESGADDAGKKKARTE